MAAGTFCNPRDLPRTPVFSGYKVTFFVFNGLGIDFAVKCNFVTGGRARWREVHDGKKLVRFGSNRF
jgi:hypothetical protein